MFLFNDVLIIGLKDSLETYQFHTTHILRKLKRVAFEEDCLLLEDMLGQITQIGLPSVTSDEQHLWLADLQEGAERAKRLHEQKRRRKQTLAQEQHENEEKETS